MHSSRCDFALVHITHHPAGIVEDKVDPRIAVLAIGGVVRSDCQDYTLNSCEAYCPLED